MATRRIKDPITGQLTEAQIVEINEEENNAIILKLEDGAVLRLKIDIAQVVWTSSTDFSDEPIYRVQSTNSLVVLDLPIRPNLSNA